MPQLAYQAGRYALIVDGEPFLILGAQCNNSSAWPVTLPKVWTAMEELHVNTLEIPIYWEQFEPEPGTWGSVRDHSPDAQTRFGSAVPKEALAAKGKSDQTGRNWSEVFGRDAEEYFHVGCVARFIGRVASAGNAVYPLPLVVNASIRDPIDPGRPPRYEVGGPNDNVFDLWKAAAPAVDILAPDIYQSDPEKYLKVLDLYSRPDNPLFIPETIGFGALTRFLFAALGRGAESSPRVRTAVS